MWLEYYVNDLTQRVFTIFVQNGGPSGVLDSKCEALPLSLVTVQTAND